MKTKKEEFMENLQICFQVHVLGILSKKAFKSQLTAYAFFCLALMEKSGIWIEFQIQFVDIMVELWQTIGK